jgi:hypothetical protein
MGFLQLHTIDPIPGFKTAGRLASWGPTLEDNQRRDEENRRKLLTRFPAD